MKLPRDVDAKSLIRALGHLGCARTRQTGSHVRRTCPAPTPPSVTVPDHSPIKPGTLNAILADGATHHRIEKSALIEKRFG